MAVHIGRNASDRRFCEWPGIDADDYHAACRRIVRAFDLKPSTDLVAGLDVVFQLYTRDVFKVVLRWDIWMGFSVSADTPDSDKLVDEIARWITSRVAKD
jgi:hypothetical protein